MWTLEYYQYRFLKEYVAATKEDALNFGVRGEEEGRLSMNRLISPSGDVVMKKAQLSEYFRNA